MITVTCPSCGQESKAPDQFRGQDARCPSCGQPLTIPGGRETPVLGEDDLIDRPAVRFWRARWHKSVTLAVALLLFLTIIGVAVWLINKTAHEMTEEMRRSNGRAPTSKLRR